MGRRDGLGGGSARSGGLAPHGKLTIMVMSGVAEFERDILIERTKEGIAAARARGKRIGRPPKMTANQIRRARERIADGKE